MDRQLQLYEQALQLFSARKNDEAWKCFLEVAKGPASHIADKARAYAQVCERRSQGMSPKLATAEDHFNYGVERMNARDMEKANQHLREALQLSPNADHILYTMALCCGLSGDGDGACANLKRAIELEPRNRILARQDAEFSVLAAQFPAVRALLATGSSDRY